MDDDERQHLEDLVHTYQRRLRPLETREAQSGINTPPEVINEIEDIRSKIARIQAQLGGQTGAAVPQPAPAPEQIDARRLRRQALTVFYTQRWEHAITLLAQLTAADPTDEDAWIKLARAQRERHWQLRYEEICELRDDDEWEAVLGALHELAQERPGYPDPQGLRAWAESRQRREEHYDAALTAFEHAEWPAAITALDALLADAPDDAESQTLLQHARAEQQAAAEQARKQEKQKRQQQQDIATHVRTQRFQPAYLYIVDKDYIKAIDVLESLLQQQDDQQLAALLMASFTEQADVSLQQRMRAAGMVDVVGDPRPGLQLEQPEYWAQRIEPGPFLMGDDNGRDNDKPAFIYHIRQPYALARYLVTNSQYARFLADLERQGNAAEAQKRRLRDWEDNRAPSGLGNHPVVYVSGEDATAFAAWADWMLRAAGLLGPGEIVRLPTEPEWERAAAYPVALPAGNPGAGRREYPWGAWPTNDLFANTEESKIGDTSVVGLFPQGAADCGALDMAGNAWEWCSTPYLSYKEIAQRGQIAAKTLDNYQSENRYVLRGGSWNRVRQIARCAYRLDVNPGRTIRVTIGFRLARCSPIPPSVETDG